MAYTIHAVDRPRPKARLRSLRMCGRATLTVDVEEIAEIIGALPLEGGLPTKRKGWNLAPTDPMLIVRPRREGPEREMAVARWGLIPWWAKKDEAKKLGGRFVQARVETLAKTPAFRDAFKRHRCLVIVDGFYEWKTASDGNRMPHHVHREDRKPFAIAGVWDSWTSPETGEIIESCAVVTTEAKGHIADIHDRMPLVIGKDAYDAWLKGTPDEASKVRAVTPDLVTMAVSKYVNNVRHDDEQCIAPLTE
jgi:putative SOS response-associated peptidase YedK